MADIRKLQEIANLEYIFNQAHFSEIEKKELTTRLIQTVNVAIIEEIRAKLNNHEQYIFTEKLTSSPLTPQHVSEILEETCKTSSSELNFQKIAIDTQLKTMQSFLFDLIAVLPLQKKAAVYKVYADITRAVLKNEYE